METEFPNFLRENRLDIAFLSHFTYWRKVVMNLWFYSFRQLNFEELLNVYEEDIRVNGSQLYPGESADQQLRLAEQDFADYLRCTFFRQKSAAYCVLCDKERYVCAARIEEYEDGYLLSALATRPGYRRMGNGKRFLSTLLNHCAGEGKLPIYSHVANINKASMGLHLQCGFRILKDTAKYLDGSVHADSKTLLYEK